MKPDLITTKEARTVDALGRNRPEFALPGELLHPLPGDVQDDSPRSEAQRVAE